MNLSRKLQSAFTLVELLVVIAIMLIMMALLGPAVTAIKGGNDITSAAYTISGAIEGARSYAIANNTYTWVGFYEEDAGTLIPTAVKPPYPGKGRVLMAVVYSKDGTTSCQNSASTVANPIPMTATLISQLGKLIKLENIHVTEVGKPAGSTNLNILDGRPDLAYTYGSPGEHYNRISSDDPSSAQVSGDITKFPFVAQGYTFYKTIQFNPRGEASVNSTYGMKPIVEIGLRPTHGTTVDTNNKNVVAIQMTGVAGNVKIYRR